MRHHKNEEVLQRAMNRDRANDEPQGAGWTASLAIKAVVVWSHIVSLEPMQRVAD